jgi:hypothetical protein
MNKLDEQFAIFWNAYPKRVGRKKAEEAFAKAMKKTTLDVILKALEWQVRQPQWLKDDGEYIIYPQGYLNQERWLDECPASLKPKPVSTPLMLAHCGDCGNTGWLTNAQGEATGRCHCRMQKARTA